MSTDKVVRKAVIPAAGLGTRFLPATKAQPKEMLPVVDEPSIQYVVEEAVAAGIDDILIITGRDKRSLEDHFDRNFELEYHLAEKGKTRATSPRSSSSPSWPTSTTSARASPSGSATPCRWPASTSATNPFVVMLGDDIMRPALHRADGHDRHLRGNTAARSSPSWRSTAEDISAYGCAAPEVDQATPRAASSTSSRSPKAEDAPSNLAVMGRYVFTPAIFEAHRAGRSPASAARSSSPTPSALLLKEETVYGLRSSKRSLRHRQEDRLPAGDRRARRSSATTSAPSSARCSPRSSGVTASADALASAP